MTIFAIYWLGFVLSLGLHRNEGYPPGIVLLTGLIWPFEPLIWLWAAIK